MQNKEERIISVNIEEEMKSSYIDYSMSVIVSRALPDVRDGLKPVHRRVLFGMHELGVASNKAYKKSARIVGDVMGKYHPHGDAAIYETLVRMAQGWSVRYKMIDGHGNFGSIDNDPPAAMRYTEIRLDKISEEMLGDLEKETVDLKLNFDDSLYEPTVLPTRIPNLLINGASGIAVGMATNMAPHNLGEVIDAICAYIDNNEIEIEELIEHVKAPDFPTGGIIFGYEGVKEAFKTGRGKVVLRAKTKFEQIQGRECIVVEEIPYQVNKADMIAKTADLVKDGKLEGISIIRDESDRKGLRIVYILKNDAIASVVLNQLFKYTSLQTSFNVNNIALVKGQPKQLNLKELIVYFVEHRHEVVIRRAQYELKKHKERAHILEGLLIALDHLDEVIRLIRNSPNPEEARLGLIAKFSLSEIQARAILDMRLQRLTGLERDKIGQEAKEVAAHIARLEEFLGSEPLRMKLIKEEIEEIRSKFADPRRSEIDYVGGEVNIEDLIADEQVVLTISHAGYIKRTPLSEYKRQSRGGVGNKGVLMREEDFTEHLLIATNHQYMLFFTEKGRCFWLRVYEIPEGSKTTKGRAIQNLIQIEKEDKVRAFILTKDLNNQEYINNNYIIMVTQKGIVKKTTLEQYSRPRKNGINAITIRQGDRLLEAKLTSGTSEILIALSSGKAIRFLEEKVRPMGRGASGVKSITPSNEKDFVIGMVCINDKENEDILVVSEKGYGKRSKLDYYRITHRGGKGVKTINVTPKTGALIAIKSVENKDDLMIINKSGIIIRMGVADLRQMGRATQGVRLINLKGKDEIAAVAKVNFQELEEKEKQEES